MDQSNRLYVIDRDGSNNQPGTDLKPDGVAPNCGDDSISWSPDGTRIAFEGRASILPIMRIFISPQRTATR
jgi:Tol biopolymer transport system component